MTDNIEPVYITPAALSTASIGSLNGEELDLLDDIGVHLMQLRDAAPNRALVAFGWLKLRRKYPDLNLSYTDARKHVIWKMDDDEVEVPDVDPTDDAV